MSLSARIAIGPSARMTAVEVLAVVGGLVVTTATLGAWLALPWSSAVVGSALACVSSRLVWLRRMAAGTRTVIVSEGRDITLRGSDGVFTRWCLDDATTAWPGFIGLSLARADRSGAPQTLIALRSALHADDARHLHRYLLWAARGGCRTGSGSAVDRGFR